jgi:hypothetical protein
MREAVKGLWLTNQGRCQPFAGGPLRQNCKKFGAVVGALQLPRVVWFSPPRATTAPKSLEREYMAQWCSLTRRQPRLHIYLRGGKRRNRTGSGQRCGWFSKIGNGLWFAGTGVIAVLDTPLSLAASTSDSLEAAMPSIDFRQLRANVSMAEVLNLLRSVVVKRTGDQVRGECPLHEPSESGNHRSIRRIWAETCSGASPVTPSR